MQVKVTPIKAKSQVELSVAIPADVFGPYIERAGRNETKTRPLRGFRPGKAPLSAVIAAFGQEHILHEAMELSLSRFFVQAAVENDIEAINRPSITIETLGLSEPFEFTAIVDVLPEVKIKNLKDVKAERKKVEVEDKDVEEELKYLAKLREKKVEELDDAFAKSLGKFESLEDLKKKLKENIQHEKEHHEQDRYRAALMEKLAENAEFGFIPEALLKDKKERDVKMGLALRAFAKEQKIEVTPEDIQARAQMYLQQFGDPEAAAKLIDIDKLKENIESSLRNQKALQRLEELAEKKK